MPTADATITFAQINPERAGTILAALRIHGFRHRGTSVCAPLRLFTEYKVRDATTMIATQLGTLIRQLDPTAVFTICQDPCNEFVGQKLISDPGLGEHLCALDEHRAELITGHTLRYSIDTARHVLVAGGDPAAALAELDHALGGPWHRQIALLRALDGTHLDALTT